MPIPHAIHASRKAASIAGRGNVIVTMLLYQTLCAKRARQTRASRDALPKRGASHTRHCVQGKPGNPKHRGMRCRKKVGLAYHMSATLNGCLCCDAWPRAVGVVVCQFPTRPTRHERRKALRERRPRAAHVPVLREALKREHATRFGATCGMCQRTFVFDVMPAACARMCPHMCQIM